MQKIKVFHLLWILSIFHISLIASPSEWANELNLVAGKKAIIQWERVFKSERKMKKYGIDKLSKEQQLELEKYLLTHAADSDHPTIAGM